MKVASTAALLQAILAQEGLTLKHQHEALHQALSAVIRRRQEEAHEKEV
jgi:hypothetical protein